MLKENEELLNKITEKLLEKETLMGDEFMAMVKGEDESTSKGTKVEEKEKEVDENEIEDRILDEKVIDESIMETKRVSDKSPIEE
jgi:cell division protease FtsH